MSDAVLREVRDLIQEDVNHRGLATDPTANLINACPDDFAAACGGIAETPNAGLCIVTGFYIADADPPAGETDGPLGALYLARALTPLGFRVALQTDFFCKKALQVGLEACSLDGPVTVLTLPPAQHPWDAFLELDWRREVVRRAGLTHLIALERVGPSYGGPCYSMRGVDVTAAMSPAHRVFEDAAQPPRITTIGVGDGGNEIGMGKVPRDVIARNIPNGGLIACRVPTDYLIVCGVSNWGAYALAAGVALARGARLGPSLFDEDRERELLRVMVEKGPLVDGVTGKPTVSVDGLPFEEYVKPLRRIKDLLGW
jgi:D-glutamate cyclase